MFLHANSGMSGISAVCGVPHLTFVPTQLPGYVDSPFNVAYLRWAGRLWQDTAMTVPAVADGDPVRRIVCGSTYYDAPSDAARPLLWDEGGGKWSLSFDGVDDRLVGASVTGWQNTKTVGLSCLFATGGSRWACGQGNNDPTEELAIARQSSGAGYMDVGAGLGPYVEPAGVTGGAYSSTVWVQSTAAGTTSLSCYQGGVLLSGSVSGSGLTPNAATGVAFMVGAARSTSLLYMYGRIAGVVVCTTALGSTDRAALDTYLAALHT